MNRLHLGLSLCEEFNPQTPYRSVCVCRPVDDPHCTNRRSFQEPGRARSDGPFFAIRGKPQSRVGRPWNFSAEPMFLFLATSPSVAARPDRSSPPASRSVIGAGNREAANRRRLVVSLFEILSLRLVSIPSPNPRRPLFTGRVLEFPKTKNPSSAAICALSLEPVERVIVIGSVATSTSGSDTLKSIACTSLYRKAISRPRCFGLRLKPASKSRGLVIMLKSQRGGCEAFARFRRSLLGLIVRIHI